MDIIVVRYIAGGMLYRRNVNQHLKISERSRVIGHQMSSFGEYPALSYKAQDPGHHDLYTFTALLLYRLH